MFNFLYTTKVDILYKSGESKDDRGRMIPMYALLETILADMQPNTTAYNNGKYGKFSKSEFVLYMEPNNNINKDSLVEINSIRYIIDEVIPWDDYYMVGIHYHEYA